MRATLLIATLLTVGTAAPAVADDFFERTIDPWEEGSVVADSRQEELRVRRPVSANPRRFVLSSYGPGRDNGALSVGGSAYIISTEVILPYGLFELNYVRGINDWIDIEGRVSSIFMLNVLDGGARFHFGDHRFSAALRTDLTIFGLVLLGENASAGAALVGATPGLLLSGGTEELQVTASLDAPLFFAAVGTEALSEVDYLLRPQIGVEFPVGETTNMYVRAELFAHADAGVVLYGLGAGAAW